VVVARNNGTKNLFGQPEEILYEFRHIANPGEIPVQHIDIEPGENKKKQHLVPGDMRRVQDKLKQPVLGQKTQDLIYYALHGMAVQHAITIDEYNKPFQSILPEFIGIDIVLQVLHLPEKEEKIEKLLEGFMIVFIDQLTHHGDKFIFRDILKNGFDPADLGKGRIMQDGFHVKYVGIIDMRITGKSVIVFFIFHMAPLAETGCYVTGPIIY
jgi:hypothetical protein